MELYNKLTKFLKNPQNYLTKRELFHRIRKLLAKYLPSSLFWDEFYMKSTYRLFFGKKLNLKNPQTFNEKLRWLILYDRNPLYSKLADKFLVREYVSERICSTYLKPIIGLYTKPEEIDWEALPNRFAIKMTHGSHMNLIIEDKNDTSKEQCFSKIRKWLKSNFYYQHREWHYKDIEPKILIEEYLEPSTKNNLLELNFYCFHGRPIFIEANVSIDSVSYRSYLNCDWQVQPFLARYELPPKPTKKPLKFEEMIDLTEKLSDGLRFCRVDLLYVDKKILFGELTLTPGAGYIEFKPKKYDKIFGDLINLELIEQTCI